jgi:hypothetical protein
VIVKVDPVAPEIVVQVGVPEREDVVCQVKDLVGVGDPVNVTAEVRTVPLITAALTSALVGAAVELT